MRNGAVWVMVISMLASGVVYSAEFEEGRRHRRHKHQGHPGLRLLGMVNTLEYLSAETAPATFTVDLFPDQDTNADGVLSDEEWNTFANATTADIVGHIVKRSPEADTDGDGALNSEELQAFVDEKVASFREKVLDRDADLDTNGDGVLSDEEFTALEQEKLQRILEDHPQADLDADGTLTTEEITAGKLSKKIQHKSMKRERRTRSSAKKGARRRGGF